MLMELAYSFHLLHDLACFLCVPLSTALSRVICTATQSEMRLFLWAVEEFWSKREPARGKKIWWWGLVHCQICHCNRRGHWLHHFLLPWNTGCMSWFPFTGRRRRASLLPLFLLMLVLGILQACWYWTSLTTLWPSCCWSSIERSHWDSIDC